MKLNNYEQAVLNQPMSKGYLILSNGGYDLRSCSPITELFVYLISMIIAWYQNAEVKKVDDVKKVAQAKHRFTEMLEALKSEDQGKILTQLDSYREEHAAMVLFGSLDAEVSQVYRDGTSEVSQKVQELANRTDTIADLIFAVVIREKAGCVLDGTKLQPLPTNGIRGAVVDRLKSRSLEEALQVGEQEGPMSAAVVYLMRKERGLESIDLKERFKAFLGERAAEFMKLVEENRATFDRYRSEQKKMREAEHDAIKYHNIKELDNISLELQTQSTTLKELDEELFSELEAIEDALASLESSEVNQLWREVRSELFKSQPDLRAEVLALKEEIEGEKVEEQKEELAFPTPSELSKFQAVLRAIPTAQPALLDVRFGSALDHLKGERRSDADIPNELRELQQYVDARIRLLEEGHHSKIKPLQEEIELLEADRTYERERAEALRKIPNGDQRIILNRVRQQQREKTIASHELRVAEIEQEIEGYRRAIDREGEQLITLHSLNETLEELAQSTSRSKVEDQRAFHLKCILNHLTTYHGRLDSIQTL